MSQVALSNDPPVSHIAAIDAAISHCAKHCNHPTLSPGFIPSRLLFIGFDDNGIANIRLIPHSNLTAETSPQIKYAALSYCWGSSEDAKAQCKTTAQSLSSRLAKIPSDELSPVVRDAVSVCRQLGISYLWIDSLCIIQDDLYDWEAESAVMGQIYSNAYVTIVGLNSPSCRVGFLSWREWPYFKVTGGKVSTPTLTSVEDASVPSEKYVGPDTWLFARVLNKAKWSTRGWTFQEKALSTRLLYFDHLNIHLRCANYTFRDGRAGPLLGKQLAFLEPDQGVDVDVDGMMSSVESILESWRNILIPKFATCDFSVAMDRLPAISGLAKYIGEVTGYQYAAGLWVPCFYRDLAWSGRKAGRGSRFEGLVDSLNPASDYIAPSWSWARNEVVEKLEFVDIPTDPNLDTDLEVSAQFEVSVQLKGLNPYGRVSSGELVITSRMVPLLPEEYEKLESKTGHSGFEFDWVPGEGKGLPIGLEMVLIGSYNVKVRTKPDIGNTDQRRLYGLVVYPAHVPGRYYRVGMFNNPLFGQSWTNFEGAQCKEITII